VIVSYHNFNEVPKNIPEIYEAIKKTKCDIIKIACMANSITDNLTIFDLIKKAGKEGKNIIALCMGEKGELSRILGLAYGSYLTYGCIEDGRGSAPGQISCTTLKNIYRANEVRESWKIYGLLGNPVSESKGYIIHNLAFAHKKMNAVYVNFLVENLEEFIYYFSSIFSGLSITMPFKREIMAYLDEIDRDAGKIGAVNTVVVRNNKLIGYNTDIYGAMRAIEEKEKIKGKNILMLGSGGVAGAIGYGIKKNKGNLIITNRTAEKGIKLANELGCKFVDYDRIDWKKIDILVNATSVGMLPEMNKSPVSGKYLKNMLVFDAIYNPSETKLVKLAKKNKCKTISGKKMFVYQAEKQFELWAAKKLENGFMEKALSKAL
jgi:3-dehydroquinate dehydratase/shikimate dehydrogenase